MGRRNFKNGFTLSEVIVAVGILGVLISLSLIALKPRLQLAKVRDTRRKTDLKRISIALEDYAGDHPCYPLPEMMICNPGDGLRPYLNKIPCDPLTGASYPYARPDDCSQFVLYASLELEQPFDYGAGNYAVSSSNLRVIPTIITTPTPTFGPVPPTFTPTLGPTPTIDISGTFFGCKSGVCVPLSLPLCAPNYQGYPNCDLGGVNLCGSPELPKNECN